MSGTRLLRLDVSVESWPLKAPFRIAGHVFTHSEMVVVTLDKGGCKGRGEAAGVFYMGDDPQTMADTLLRLKPDIEAGVSREVLRGLLPAGGARNALDCALWEIESLESGRPVWAIAGMDAPRPLQTTLTLGAESPATMVAGALAYGDATALKLKLTGETDLDIERVQAVRRARPGVWLAVDANQAYTPATLEPLVSVLMDAGVSLLEQPFGRGSERELDGLDLPLDVAADESCLDIDELDELVGRFDVVNIKLDKCGGLTEALMMAHRAQALGLKIMMGNMVGTSLAMAPAFVIGQLCDVVDLDGPTFLVDDRAPGVCYAQGKIWCPPEVWGAASREEKSVPPPATSAFGVSQ